jgi:hypothetical protein
MGLSAAAAPCSLACCSRKISTRLTLGGCASGSGCAAGGSSAGLSLRYASSGFGLGGKSAAIIAGVIVLMRMVVFRDLNRFRSSAIVHPLARTATASP